MKNEEECPLEGSWSQAYCSIHKNQIASGMLPSCSYRGECTALRKIIESDPNLSTLVTKALLVGGIPYMLGYVSLLQGASK